MKTSRREFLQTSALASLAAVHSTHSLGSDSRTTGISMDGHLNASEIARRHMIVRDIPSPSFFDGMLLGNGDVGACVVVRPDALGIHIGKNDCWDIRVSEDIADHVLPFREVLQLWQRASEEAKRMGKPDMLYLETKVAFFREYSERVGEFLRRKKVASPLAVRHHLDQLGSHMGRARPTHSRPCYWLVHPTLRCTNVENENSRVQLFVFVDWETGLISASTDQALPLRSVRYSPEVDGFHAGFFESGKRKESSEFMPPPETSAAIFPDFAEFSSFQYFPALGPTSDRPSPPSSDKDRNFTLYGRVSGRWSVEPADPASDVQLKPKTRQLLRIDAFVATPRDSL